MTFLGPQLCHPMKSFLNHVFQNVLCNLLKHHPSKTLNKHTHTHTHTHTVIVHLRSLVIIILEKMDGQIITERVSH